ncbi:hypothetical protein BDR05DRAFT_949432 [Suillus weaverae]|nr:hypothetical protein BDR05DRAFT_949432 [Suillus weaverae]
MHWNSNNISSNYPTSLGLLNIPTWDDTNCTSQKTTERLQRYTKKHIIRNCELSSSDPETKFHKLINGSTHTFLENLTLQYMGSSHSEQSQQPIQEALDTAQEAEDVTRESGGDGTECRQVILSLEDILLRVFEDMDITSAHFWGLLSSQNNTAACRLAIALWLDGAITSNSIFLDPVLPPAKHITKYFKDYNFSHDM